MPDRICRSIDKPIRKGLSAEEAWKASDNGLIASWEAGRKLAVSDPELASRVREGELPVLGWKGGAAVTIQSKKFGSLKYLAMWQGLNDEDLDISLSSDVQITCKRTDMTVTYTADSTKYATP